MDVRGSLQLGRGAVEEGEGEEAGAGQIGLGGLAPSQPGERECRQIQLILILRLASFCTTCRLFFLGPLLWYETRTIWTDMFESSLSHVKWIVNKKSEYTIGRPYRSCIFSYNISFLLR